jgi:hypothetical protein
LREVFTVDLWPSVAVPSTDAPSPVPLHVI